MAIESAWAKIETKRESIEWVNVWREQANIARLSRLPKVLVVGDSIVGNYFPTISSELKGIADCTRLNGSRVVGDPILLKEFQLVNDEKYDVIHVNNGLHGYDTTDADYGRCLGDYIDYIRSCQPQAKIVWGRSTQMTPAFSEYERIKDRLVVRNRLADEVMKSRGIPMTDLYAVAFGKQDLYAPDGIHFNEKGSRELGLAVVVSIKKALGL
ncbi:MAG: SGNH/GDSL hydrolase family protein [Kiritimatiellia bacterium]